jgi:23S rRNA (guanosine2251-2'-O)-methyltransferase
VKAANIWCVGLDERGTMDYTEYDFTTPCLLVLGREGAGLHDLVRRHCDHLLRIPMAGKVASLNVSAAGAVVLYEAYRQRRRALQSLAARAKAVPDKSVPEKSVPERSVPAKPRKGLGS